MGLYWGCTGTMEKEMETTVLRGHVGMVHDLCACTLFNTIV